MADLSIERVSFEQALDNLLALYGTQEINVTVGSPFRMSLINLTKAKLDEIIPEGEGLQFKLEDDTNISDPLNLLINAILNEAARRVQLNCPLHYLSPVKSDITTGITDPYDNKIGHIVLPNNFLRFVSLKMSDWKRPANKLITPDRDVEEYAMQKNEFVRGGTSKPVAASAWNTTYEGKRGLQAVAMPLIKTAYIPDYQPGENILEVIQIGASGGAISVVADDNGEVISINGIVSEGTGYYISGSVNTSSPIGSGFKVAITAITPDYVTRRIIEYYSVKDTHNIDYLYYIQELVAEKLQSSLWNALTWVAASMVLQITERVDLAKVALEQEQACYINL